MHPILLAAADLVLGATCLICGRPAWGACDDCRGAVEGEVPHHVHRAGLGPPCVGANDYRLGLDDLIPRFKDDAAWHLGPLLVGRLGAALATLGPSREAVLSPVPSRPRAVRARGFDHTVHLTRRLSRISGLRWARILSRTSVGADQEGLGRAGRGRNVARTMVARGISGRVILVDDVVTTGATLIEATTAIGRAGGRVEGIIVVADANRARTGAQAPLGR